ncbi:MAG: hypothetical protein HOP33_01725 [Verrucomicrobia bacterium]|nr:hypothetical protein [Verrucomicrobiota bacterium]
MIPLDKLNSMFRAPQLTRTRIMLALLVALVADGLQIPFQLVPMAPEIIDVIAMLLTVWLLGFHLLLLPTFVVEFIPLVDMLPTWTGCVIAVIALRKRAQHNTPPPPVINLPPEADQKNLPPPAQQ